MSATAHCAAAGAGPLAARPAAARSQPYAENAAWEMERDLLLGRSDRRAWTVAMLMSVLALLAVGAVLAHGALYQTVAVPIVVDKATGETSVTQALDVDSVPAYEALDKHNAMLYVLARERYNWSFLQMDYDTVAALAAPAVFRDYAGQFEGPTAMQSRLGEATEFKVHIVNIRLEPQTRAGRAGVAVVTFTRQVAARDRAPEPEARWLATVSYEYQPKLRLKERDRLQNPFGFVVTAYRADPDINSVVTRTGS